MAEFTNRDIRKCQQSAYSGIRQTFAPRSPRRPGSDGDVLIRESPGWGAGAARVTAKAAKRVSVDNISSRKDRQNGMVSSRLSNGRTTNSRHTNV